MPNATSYKSILFENILPILKIKTKVHVTWLIYKPTKLNLHPQDYSDVTILDIHDYKNAIEIVEKVKPHIIYISTGLNASDYTLLLAGKFFNIPVVGGEIGIPLFAKHTRIEIIRSYITQLFQSTIIDSNENKQFLGKIRFFIYKHLFLLRTLKAAKMSKIKILETLFILMMTYLRIINHNDLENSRFACTLNFLENEDAIEPLVKAGFKRSSLLATGNPTYDTVFRHSLEYKPSPRKDGKTRILLLTNNPHDPGTRWRKSLWKTMIKEIVTEIIKHKNEMLLVIKIHPTGENLLEYQSLINSIDPSVHVYQKGDIMSFLEEADVVISHSTSTALVCSLIYKKPIIIYNIFNVKGDVFLENELALECKKASELIPLIHQALSSNPETVKKIEEYIGKFVYKLDGRSYERMSNAIIELLKNQLKI